LGGFANQNNQVWNSGFWMTFWCATLPGFKKHISPLSLTIAIANLQCGFPSV
jgi:hypothetical protein